MSRMSRASERRRITERVSRETAELVDLAERYYASESDTAYHAARGISGVPSDANRTYRVAASSWDVHHAIRADGTLQAVGPIRTVGNAYRGAPAGTVRVTRHGITTVETVASFRRTRERGTSQAAATAQNVAQARRLALLESTGYATELASGDA